MDWFLIKENEHLGPFDEETIRELFSDGQCSEEDQIWKDGWVDTKTFAEVFLEDQESPPEETFKPLAETISAEVAEETSAEKTSPEKPEEEDDVPPPLPPLPVESATPESAPPHAGIITKNTIAPQPEEVAQSSVPLRPTPVEDIEPEEVDLDFDAEEFEIDQTEKRLLRLARNLALVLIGTIVIVSGYFYFFNKVEVFERPKIMTLGDYDRLSRVAESNPKNLDFAFALASDKRTLWAATNTSLEGEVFVVLKSKKGRILGNDVEVKARGNLKNRLITFSEFQFVQGTKFIDGYYDVEIYTVDDLKIPFFSQLGSNTEKQFRFINEFLITSMNREDFNQQLNRYASRRKMNSSEFWLEISEKYRTVRSITDQIRTGFTKVLQTPSDQYEKAIKQFRDDYAKRYGVFFTSFVQDNEKSYERLVDKEFEDRIEVMASYNELSNLSKKIGAESISLLDEIEATNPSEKNEQEWEAFTKESLVPFNLIIEECERKLALLKGRI